MKLTTYEVRCGRRAVGLHLANTAQEALGDHLRGLGCKPDEIRKLGTDAASWRGAVYRAVPVADGVRAA